jgi:LuxR family maltose regulon positive regulatory protein
MDVAGATNSPGAALALAPAEDPRGGAGVLDAECGAPGLRDGLVCRAELLGRLDDARSHPLVLVTAPAGYGKTTLLAQWHERGGRPLAWVTLDEADEDPACLAFSIAEAFEFSGVDPGRPGRSSVLVLDDAHGLGPGALGDAILGLLGRLPRGAQLAVASRSEPELPLGRMRGHRLVFEVGPEDLSMSPVEGASLLRKAGLDLEFTGAQDLVRRTEGWPVALELAAVALASRPDPADGPVPLAGDDHLFSEYFRTEILAPMPRATVRFLTRCSILDELSGPLCDTVLERGRSAPVLARLARANVPIQAADPSHERFRLHGLFREMLQTELRRTEPELVPELHRRASEWHGRAGDLDRAIGHARDAGDLHRAGELLWANAHHHVERDRDDVIRRWLDRITPERAAGSAPLALAAAHSRLAVGDIAHAEQWARAAAVSLSEDPTRGDSSQHAGVLMIEAWAARSGVTRMRVAAARAHELLPDDSPWRASCCLLRGTAALLGGEEAEAGRRLEEGAVRGMSAAPDAAALCLAQLAVIAIDHADRDLAGDLARRALAVVADHDLGDHPIMALAFAVAAAAAVREGRIDEAKVAAARCMALTGTIDEFAPWYAAETRILLARGSLALGDAVAAREQLADASRLARRTHGVVVFERWFDDAWNEFDKRAETGMAGLASLTTAELRVLRFLPTHYAFPEIAERLHVSSNTVKTHVHAVYRKLDASSRSEAVVNATRVGLLGY